MITVPPWVVSVFLCHSTFGAVLVDCDVVVVVWVGGLVVGEEPTEVMVGEEPSEVELSAREVGDITREVGEEAAAEMSMVASSTGVRGRSDT
jgi:hypothetical protein